MAPPRTIASFYRTSAGAEIDLVLDMPGRGRWAIEIKRSLTARPQKGFHLARQDIAPERSFVVYAGRDRYPIDPHTEAISVRGMAALLAGTEDR